MFSRKQGSHVTNFARKTKVSSYKCSVEKIKLSRLLVQRANESKMNEIQRKTPLTVKFKTVLVNSNCKLFLGLELASEIQAADDSKRTDSPA